MKWIGWSIMLVRTYLALAITADALLLPAVVVAPRLHLGKLECCIFM